MGRTRSINSSGNWSSTGYSGSSRVRGSKVAWQWANRWTAAQAAVLFWCVAKTIRSGDGDAVDVDFGQRRAGPGVWRGVDRLDSEETRRQCTHAGNRAGGAAG